MPDKPELSRRSFVTKASLGAAAAGALVVANPFGGRADAAETTATPAAAKPVKALAEPVVAQLEDVSSGAVRLHVGTRSFTVVDHTLAQHLARAVQG